MRMWLHRAELDAMLTGELQKIAGCEGSMLTVALRFRSRTLTIGALSTRLTVPAPAWISIASRIRRDVSGSTSLVPAAD